MTKTYRTPWGIQASILDYCRTLTRQSRVVQGCSMSQYIVVRITDELISKGFIERFIQQPKSSFKGSQLLVLGVEYKTTSKGLQYLELIK